MERARDDGFSIPHTPEMRPCYVMGHGSLSVHGLWNEPFCLDEITVSLILQ